MASILMPQPDLPFEGGIKIDATRLNPAFVLAFWRQNGANCRCFLTSGTKTEPISRKISSHTPTATFAPPKRHFFHNFLKPFWSVLFAGKGGLYLLGLSIPLQQHGGSKNDILFLTF